MGSIYLIRHGQASFGADDYDVLCPNGVRQAEVLGEHLANVGITLHRCYSGELRRQRDTAAHVLRHMGSGEDSSTIAIDGAFNEFKADELIRAHLPELMEYEPNTLNILRNVTRHPGEFQRLFAFVIDRWLSGTSDKPGQESWQAFSARAQQGLQRVLNDAETGEHIAVFTSAGTITALLHQIIDVPPSKAFELNWQIVNTSVTQLKFRNSEVSLASFNSHAHLQLLKAPELITYR